MQGLALALEDKRNMTNMLPPVLSKYCTQKTTFLRPGEQLPRKGVNTNPRPVQLEAARDWRILADVDQQLIFPPEIATTNLRPDIVLWSGSACHVHLRVNSVMGGCCRWGVWAEETEVCPTSQWSGTARMESPGLPSGSGLSRICGTLYNPVQTGRQIQWPRVASHSEELIWSSREEQQLAVVETERFWLGISSTIERKKQMLMYR